MHDCMDAGGRAKQEAKAEEQRSGVPREEESQECGH